MGLQRCDGSAARALWWARALGSPIKGPRGYTPVNLLPFDSDRNPQLRYSTFASLGDPPFPFHEQRARVLRSADGRTYAWGILPGQAGLVVVDVDDPAILPDVVARYGDTPVKVRTPRGGTHLYYLVPSDDEVGVASRGGVRGPHSYDVKSNGLPCHIPGQRHHILRDVRYIADVPGGWRGGTDSDSWAPGELRALLPVFDKAALDDDWYAHHPREATHDGPARVLQATPTEMARGYAYVTSAGFAVSGERHEQTRKFILKLGDFGFPPAAIAEIMERWNAEMCDPPWSATELSRKLEHYTVRRTQPVGCRASQIEDGSADAGAPAEDADTDLVVDTRMLAKACDDLNTKPPPEVVVPVDVSERGVEISEQYATACAAAVEVRALGGSKADVAQAVATAAPGMSLLDKQRATADVLGTSALPHIDVDDLFADVPAALAQCRECRHDLRMSSCDVPALFALGFASAALAARCRIRVNTRWSPPPHLFVVASVQSGRGKSGSIERMGFILTRRWQTDVGVEWEEYARVAGVKRSVAKAVCADYERQVVRIRKAIDAARAEGKSTSEQEAEAKRIEARIVAETATASANQITKPTWIQADSSPAKFVDMVREHGFALLAAPEGSTILQAFSQGNVASLLSGWSGESMDKARVGGGPNPVVRVDRYHEMHTCMVLPVQNFLLEPSGGLADRERSSVLRDLAASGFFARCLVAREEVVGVCNAPDEFDDSWVDIIPASEAKSAAQREWDGLLTSIWLSGAEPVPAQPLAPEFPATPHIIALDEDASNYLLRFQSWAAEQAKPGGRWSTERVVESASRIGEMAIRVAAVLAVMRIRSCKGVSVSLAEAQRAVRFCKDYAMPLVAHLLERAKPDPIADDALVVLGKLSDLQVGTTAVAKRALQHKLGRGWGKLDPNSRVSRLDAALEHLETLGTVSVSRSPSRAITSVLQLERKPR